MYKHPNQLSTQTTYFFQGLLQKESVKLYKNTCDEGKQTMDKTEKKTEECVHLIK